LEDVVRLSILGRIWVNILQEKAAVFQSCYD